MSQAELARRVGAKQQTIQYLCSSAAKKSSLTVQIAAELSVDALWLATGKGELYGVDPSARAHDSVNKETLRMAIELLFSAAQNAEFDLAHIPAGQCANIVSLAYDLLGENHQNEEEALRIVRRVIMTMLEQAGASSEQARGTPG